MLCDFKNVIPLNISQVSTMLIFLSRWQQRDTKGGRGFSCSTLNTQCRSEAIWWTSVPATGLELSVPPILQPPSGNSLSVALSTWKPESLRFFTSPSVKLPLTSTNAQKAFFYTCVPEGLSPDTSILIHSAGLSTSWSVSRRTTVTCCFFCKPSAHSACLLIAAWRVPTLSVHPPYIQVTSC